MLCYVAWDFSNGGNEWNCPEGFRCAGERGCVEPVHAGERCVGQPCSGGPCSLATCRTYVLPGDACAEPDRRCVPGSECVDGLCVPPAMIGQPCRDGACLEGACLDGICSFVPSGGVCDDDEDCENGCVAGTCGAPVASSAAQCQWAGQPCVGGVCTRLDVRTIEFGCFPACE
jgi:hypothetical protein